MYTAEEVKIMNFGDTFSMLYGCICKKLMEEFGFEGERAVRLGTRYYGRYRGLAEQKVHLENGLKINLENLFTRFYDLPTDPRFRRELQWINPQERVSHSLVCPMADIWKAYGLQTIGRIYCEEFHPACYGSYAFDQTYVYLGRALTQDGDEYCEFNLKLRPENMPEELRKKCFAEYDPDYVEPEIHEEPIDARCGFGNISLYVYYGLLKAAAEVLGPQGEACVVAALKDAADVTAEIIRQHAEENEAEVDLTYAEENSLFRFSAWDNPKWAEELTDYQARERFEEMYCKNVRKAFSEA